MVKRLLIGLVRLYQHTLRHVLGARCRFHPSCSEYAIGAIERFGALRGSALAARRILRCNPWFEGGFDPVPSRPDADDPSPDTVSKERS